MPKTSHSFLLCSVLAALFLGAPHVHAASIVNHFGLCLEDQSGATMDRNPIVGHGCFGLFSQQWKLSGSSIMGIGTGETGDPGQPSHTKCLTQNGTQFAPVTLQTCDPGNPGQFWSIRS